MGALQKATSAARPKRIRQDGKKRTKRPGDAFHVLHGGGEEGLFVHVADSEHAGIAQAMQLFGGSLPCCPI